MDEGTLQLLQTIIVSIIIGVLTFAANQARMKPKLDAAAIKAKNEALQDNKDQNTALETRLTSNLDQKYRELLERNERLQQRLDDETDSREAAEARVAALETEREKDRQKHAAEMIELNTRMDRQRVQIDTLITTVGQLEKERDTLRAERDAARDAQKELTTKLEATTERLTRAEKQITDVTVENRTMEKIFSMFQIQIVSNHVAEEKPDVS